MILIGIIDLVVVGVLISVALRRGLEAALPWFAFALILLPSESRIRVPGLIDATSSRVAIVTIAVLYICTGKKTSDTKLKYLMLMTVGWSLLATASSIVFTTSLKAVLSQLLDYYLVYYLFFKTVTTSTTVNRLLLAIVGAMAVCCVFGFLEVYCQWSVINLFPPIQGRLGSDAGLLFDEARGLRVRSTFPHPILFGGALAMAIPLALYLLTLAPSAKQKVFLWLAVMMMFWNIYKTTSRGPWLGLILSCTMLAFFSQANTRKSLLIVVLLTITVLVVRPGVRESVENTYVATFDPDTVIGNSYSGRYDLLRLGTAALARDFSRQIWGYGPESFGDLHLETLNSEGHMAPAESCDNSWLALAIETGYFGMVLVFLMFVRALQLVLKQFFNTNGPDRYLYGLVFVNVVTFAFLMVSVAIYAWGQPAYLFWILLAIALAYPRLTTSADSQIVPKTQQATHVEEFVCYACW